MNIVCMQLDVTWEDPPANRARLESLLDSASPSKGDLVVLPEMFATGFTMNLDLAEPAKGETPEFIAKLAGQREIHILAGIASSRDEGVFNDAVMYDSRGQFVSRYSKMYLFSPAGEGDHYAAGEEVVIIDIEGTKVSPVICYDLRFPELFRIASHHGAEVMAVMANWPAVRAEHWDAMLRSRAIENQAYVIGVNRVGSDPNHDYAGGSVVYDPMGQAVVRAGGDECFISAELDIDALRAWRKQFPALKDMR